MLNKETILRRGRERREKLAMGKRLAQALAYLSINMKQASLNAGLSQTYARDVIKRGKGKIENLELLCRENGISWDWLRYKEGEIEAPIIAKKKEIALLPPPHTNAIDLTRLAAAMKQGFLICGRREALSEPEAEAMVSAVLEAAQTPVASEPQKIDSPAQELRRSLILRSGQE